MLFFYYIYSRIFYKVFLKYQAKSIPPTFTLWGKIQYSTGQALPREGGGEVSPEG